MNRAQLWTVRGTRGATVVLDYLDRTVSWLDSRGTGFAAIVLGFLVAALYGDNTAGWWTNDDPLILKQVIQFSPAEYFFMPFAWQELTAASFTPLLSLSYHLDYALFGLDPEPYYVHQLISVLLADLCFYLLLTLWVPRAFALVGAVLLIVSAPLALASAWLGIRQYTEGLAFASLACYVWVRALRRDESIGFWWAAGLYLLAILAKEVYVPLAGFLILLPERTWRKRLRASWPIGLVLAGYLVWRFWMLDGRLGGYGMYATNWGDALGIAVMVLMLPPMFFVKLFGLSWGLPISAGIAGAAFIGWMRQGSVRAVGFGLALLLLVAVPLLPVIGVAYRMPGLAEESRFLMVPAVVLITGLVVILTRHGKDRWPPAIGLLLLASLGSGLWAQGRYVLQEWQEYVSVLGNEGKFLLGWPHEAEALAISFPGLVYYRGLQWLRSHSGGGTAPSTAYGGYFGLNPAAQIGLADRKIYRYEPQCHCILEKTQAVLIERRAIQNRVRQNPFEGALNWGEGWLNWSLGPYEYGQYFLLAGTERDWYSIWVEVNRRGSRSYQMEGFMRAGYASPDGWIALSPEFYVKLTEPGQYSWTAGREDAPAVPPPK